MAVETRHKEVPWWWVFLITMPIFAESLADHGVGGKAIPFTIAKFDEVPLIISFLVSFNWVFNLFVAPLVAWYSDRIWTPIGRRKPFIIFGWLGFIIALIGVPLANNLFTLGIFVVLFYFSVDFAFTGPYAPLQNEVIPPKQRGRGGGMRTLFQKLGQLYFAMFLIGRFDETYHINMPFLNDVTITGEQFIYWSAALLIGIVIIHMLVNVKERKPQQELPKLEHFNPIHYIKGTFAQKQWLWVYSLVFCQIAMIQGLASFEGLMITRQFGYSKKAFGQIDAWTFFIEIVAVIPIAAYLADRVNRVKMFKFGVGLSMLHPIGFWVFVKYIAPHQIPSMEAIVIFNVLNKFIDIAASVALMPLIWDFIKTERAATIFSGIAVSRGIVKIIVINLLGGWIQFYTWIVSPERYAAQEWEYMSGYLFLFLLGLGGFLVVHAFSKALKKGHIVMYGKDGFTDEKQ